LVFAIRNKRFICFCFLRFGMKKLFVSLFVVHFSIAFSQNSDNNIASIITEIYKSYSEEEEKELDFDSFMEELMILSENPVNLNKATRSDFSGMVFLSENQIENLLSYIYFSEGLVNLYELQLVEGLDMTDINRMLPFVTLGEKKNKKDFPNMYEMVKYARSELLFRLDFYPQLKQGYIATPEKQSVYQGENFYNYLKYQYDCKKMIQAGFTTEKDPGEMMFGEKIHGYDFTSGYVQLSSVGVLDKIVLGDFKATFGQGLVIRQGGSCTSGAGLSNLIQINQGFRKYSSVGEYDFFRGIAGSVSLKNLNLHAFISYKMVDGNYDNHILKSLLVNGYHRTSSELENKHNVTNFTTGASVTYANKNSVLGFTCLYNQYGDSILPDIKPYSLFKASTSDNIFSGINYRFRTGKFNVFGELAMNKYGNIASLNGFTFIPVSGITMGGLFRYYNRAYDNPFASAFSKGSQVSNETGFFSGLEIETIRKIKISLQSDLFQFPWLKYGIDFPSLGEEYRIKLVYTPAVGTSININFKFRKKDDADNIEIYHTQQPILSSSASFRIQFQQLAGPCEFSSNFELKTTDKYGQLTGTAFWQNISFYKIKFPLKIDLRWMIFDIPEYQNRIYAYENDLLHAFSIPAFYGKGTRLYALFKYSLTEKLDFYLKLAETIYADGRLTIGSGYDVIQGNRKTDIKLLFRWKIPHF